MQFKGIIALVITLRIDLGRGFVCLQQGLVTIINCRPNESIWYQTVETLPNFIKYLVVLQFISINFQCCEDKVCIVFIFIFPVFTTELMQGKHSINGKNGYYYNPDILIY